MYDETLKKWVGETFFDKKGKVISARCTDIWRKCHPSPNLSKILEVTNFLPTGCKFKFRIRFIHDGKTELPKCKFCKDKNVTLVDKKLYNDYCSIKCAALDRPVPTYLHTEEIRQKIKATNKKKYGFENLFECPELQKKLQKDRKNYDPEYGKFSQIFTPELLLQEHHELKLSVLAIAKKYKCNEATVKRKIIEHGIEHKFYHTSNYEIEIRNFLDQHNVSYLSNDRSILGGKEIDVYIPDHKLGIEIHGLKYHSTEYKPSNYHKNKYLGCINKGVKLLQIFEDEWLNKPEIWQSLILNNLNISQTSVYARKCTVEEIPQNVANIFLAENHLYGKTFSAVSVALRYNEEIVGVMCFSAPRYNKTVQYELVRLCFRTNTKVIGGVSKMFEFFKTKYNPKSVVSYSDCRYSSGDIYKTLGFIVKNPNPTPNYFYVINAWKRESRHCWQKKDLVKKLSIFDPELTEKKNMENNGYYQIYDAGQLTWIWNNSILKS